MATRRRFAWARYPDRRLLDVRLKDLDVTVEGSWLERCVDELYEELAQKGIRLKPHVWLSSEWFSPSGVPGIAIPFYLAHPRLMQLERGQMMEVEGGTLHECMRIMRHEAGHTIQHAWEVHRRPRWRQLFGSSKKKYPEYYRPTPTSKRHVLHLGAWYAQAHPDEDFAETFAVWLRPRSDWRRRYADWPVALRKLEYVDELMAEIGDTPPLRKSRARPDSLKTMRKTLREHYAERQARYRRVYPDTWTRDLNRLFPPDARGQRSQSAAAFLWRNRTEIRHTVARWTGEYQLTLATVMRQMIARCRELKLRAAGSERQLKLDFTVLLAVKTMSFLYEEGRKNWIPL